MVTVIPAIDLIQGQVVRLKQGNFSKVTYYENSPLELASKYFASGRTWIHVVDLDGAKLGNLQQLELIQALKATSINIQAGGGIRSLETARSCIKAGIDRLVFGSLALSNPKLMLEIIQEIEPDTVILALDIKMEQGIPYPAIHGWQQSTSKPLWDWVEFYQAQGINRFLCTDIACDGMMNGPNFYLYQEATQRFPELNWQASGGIRHEDDIKTLEGLGIFEVILGRMLYEQELPC